MSEINPFNQQDYAFKIGSGRLIFEDQALEYLPQEIIRAGKSVYLITGPHAWTADGDKIAHVLKKACIPFFLDIYTGTCSEEKAREIITICQQQTYDVILGVGGGRIMDLAKLTANLGNIPVINMPTIAATCAAYTPLSVIYTLDGACRGTWFFRKEVDCVICDVSILSHEPERYLAAGMLDAMAKWVEINHYNHGNDPSGQDELLARLLAKNLFEDLKRDCFKAYNHDESVIKNVIFNNIVTTGIISGIARGHFQAALAHELYYAIRTLYGKESIPFLHGEVVAVGLLFQALYLENDKQAEELRALMQSMHMPISLSGIHVPANDKALKNLAASPGVSNLYHNQEKDIGKGINILKKIL